MSSNDEAIEAIADYINETLVPGVAEALDKQSEAIDRLTWALMTLTMECGLDPEELVKVSEQLREEDEAHEKARLEEEFESIVASFKDEEGGW